jgi:GNAT superfamily N-acetyltransferase
MVNIARAAHGFSAWDDLLAMILRSFSYMHRRIDPPSSALALTSDVLRQKASSEVALLAYEDQRLAGCVFLAERRDSLYLGKLAVDPPLQGCGIGRALLSSAERHAKVIGKPALELQTRVELTENQELFVKLGFAEVGRTCHPGFKRPTTLTMRKPLA